MLNSAKWWLGLGWMSLKMRVASQISYNRWSYFSLFIAQMLSYLSDMALVWAMFRAFQGVDGWSLYQVILLNAIYLMSYGISQAFTVGLWDSNDLVANGTLDDYLIRPLNPLVHLMARNFNVGYLSHLTTAIITIAVIYPHLGVAWGVLHWVFLAVSIIGASLINAALTIFPAATSFIWTRQSLLSLIQSIRFSFNKYPLGIYPTVVRIFLTVVIPIAFLNYYPAASLLGKAPLALWPLITLAVGVLMMTAALAFWRWGLARYSSSGS
ncbi:MAG: hypothetical protein GXY52_03395 [Chloroflexi bacterium]|nr:hypothetical protein [Chloroflexota bacterium]